MPALSQPPPVSTSTPLFLLALTIGNQPPDAPFSEASPPSLQATQHHPRCWHLWAHRAGAQSLPCFHSRPGPGLLSTNTCRERTASGVCRHPRGKAPQQLVISPQHPFLGVVATPAASLCQAPLWPNPRPAWVQPVTPISSPGSSASAAEGKDDHPWLQAVPVCGLPWGGSWPLVYRAWGQATLVPWTLPPVLCPSGNGGPAGCSAHLPGGPTQPLPSGLAPPWLPLEGAGCAQSHFPGTSGLWNRQWGRLWAGLAALAPSCPSCGAQCKEPDTCLSGINGHMSGATPLGELQIITALGAS